MEFKKSFNNLKRPIVWVHYALGTAGLYFAFKYLFNVDFVLQLNLKEIAMFFFVYVFIDRCSHAILSLD